jgi:signal transduction histidine kinase
MLTSSRWASEMVQVYERERQLIAYEIHDGLVQDVTGAQMHLEAALHDPCWGDGPARREAEKAVGLVRKALLEARNLIRGLRPPVLEEYGLTAAVHHLVEENSRDDLSIEYVSEMPSDRLDSFHEGAIYRIVQEAMTNVRRHSGADRALVRLTSAESRIHVEVRDWGVGFHPAKVGRDCFGLAGIRERARLLNGWASIESAPGRGTRVLVDLPVAGGPAQQVGSIKDRSPE